MADENGPGAARVHSLSRKRLPLFFVIITRHHSKKHPPELIDHTFAEPRRLRDQFRAAKMALRMNEHRPLPGATGAQLSGVGLHGGVRRHVAAGIGRMENDLHRIAWEGESRGYRWTEGSLR